MVYNLTSIASNSTSLIGYVKGVDNVLMFGWMGTLLLLGLGLLFLTNFYFATGSFKKSLTGTGFIITTLAIILLAIDFITTKTFLITLVLSAASIAFTFND